MVFKGNQALIWQMCFNEVRPIVLWYNSDQTKHTYELYLGLLCGDNNGKMHVLFSAFIAFTDSHIAALFRVIKQEALETVTHNLSTSQLDCCNMQWVWLPMKTIQKLQFVQYAVAWAVMAMPWLVAPSPRVALVAILLRGASCWFVVYKALQ